MLDIVRKSEYFEFLDRGFSTTQDSSLKGIQDGWILSQIAGVSGRRILEVGGGNSRVLPKLSCNQLWNADKYEGAGNGPTFMRTINGVSIVPTFMGEFSPNLPEVDIVFSISVVEHIPFEGYCLAFRDMERCLSPGGIMYHAIDLPLTDKPFSVAQQRIKHLIQAVEEAGLHWVTPPAIEPDVVFACDMATNSDLTTWSWGKVSESARKSGSSVQIATLKLIAKKR